MAEAPKPRATPIDPKNFLPPGLDKLGKLKGLIGNVDEFAGTVKDRAQKFDDTLTKLSDFTQKFGETVVVMSQIMEANKKLFDVMLKNAAKQMDDLTK